MERHVFHLVAPAFIGLGVGQGSLVEDDQPLTPRNDSCQLRIGGKPGQAGIADFKNQIGAGGFTLHSTGGKVISANITPDPETGIGKWSDRQIKTSITTGYRATGEKMNPPMAYHFYENISREDLDAIVAYLRSLKPVRKMRKVRFIPDKK